MNYHSPWHAMCSKVKGTSAKVLVTNTGKSFSHTLVCRESDGMRLTPAERRHAQRIHVQIPMFIRGIDAAGVEFLDLTKTLDISATGAYLASPRLLRSDQLLNLTIPAPPSPTATMPSETPPIQARVRRHGASGGIYLLGVEFVRPLD